jgi:single-strand DNA-binding protein
MAFNKTILMGRLTADVELRQTASGHQVANFTLAVDRGFGEDKKTDFFPVVAWNGLAESIARYVVKGQQILVSGQLQNRQWEDNKGSKHTTTELIATEFSFCGSLSEHPTNPSTEAKTGKNKPILEAMDGDDDIPF